MPKVKPAALNRRHDTKAEKADREAAESAMVPTTKLGPKPPSALHGKKYASAGWKRLLSLYDETQGTIITAFDEDILIKYFLAEEELVQLANLRNSIFKLWEAHLKLLQKLKPDKDNLKDYFNALAQANALLQRFQGMDARLDGKRKLVFALAQSLYLTPRSRAGVAPQEKEPDEAPSEMDDLLG